MMSITPLRTGLTAGQFTGREAGIAQLTNQFAIQHSAFVVCHITSKKHKRLCLLRLTTGEATCFRSHCDGHAVGDPVFSHPRSLLLAFHQHLRLSGSLVVMNNASEVAALVVTIAALHSHSKACNA